MFASLYLLVLTADVNAGTEAAIKASVSRVGPSVVRIETSGGRGTVGTGRTTIRKGDAPTTGLVVSVDGYIITSSFNFADKPSDVFVTVPGRDRQIAKVVAADTTRMLTLLKIDAAGLTVPEAVPTSAIKVGMWATTCGRALDQELKHPPAVSVGVVSAVGRVWGKLIQTDAKVSPTNYGGPLVALDGRVYGVLVPASPDADGDTAGAEWYDSGIGFAVPLVDILAVLPQLKDGKDLRRGKLGFTPKEPERPYTVAVEVGTVAAESPLDKAGVKPGDVITAVGGKPVANFNRLQHALGPLYEGDRVSLTIRRGDVNRDTTVTLAALVSRQTDSSLGFLPDRTVKGPGVGVRAVEPDGPLDKAGLKVGDRILRVGLVGGELADLTGRRELAEIIRRLRPETILSIERLRGKDTATVQVTVRAASDKRIDSLAAVELTGDPVTVPPPGLSHRTNPTTGRKTWVYVPDTLRKGNAPGLLIWLHPAGKGGQDATAAVEMWKTVAAERGLVLVGPESANPDGWLASEADELLGDVRAVAAECGADPARVAVVGAGAGGRMAVHLAFTARDLIRGAASIGGELSTRPRELQPGQPLWFVLVAGDSPERRTATAEEAKALREMGYPVTVDEPKGVGENTLDESIIRKLAIWIDSLDRI